MARKAGGPAFPTTEYYDEKPIGIDAGITKRDYFAAKAMQAIIANSRVLAMQKVAAEKAGTSLEYEIADGAGKMADAMLAERVK